MELACDSPVLTKYPDHPLQLTELTLSKTYYPLGFPLEVLTNSQVIVEMNDKLWGHFTHQHDTPPMRSYVHVTQGGPAECPPALAFQYVAPHCVNIADPQHYIISDLAHSETVTSITEASLQHRLYIEYFFLMAPLTTIPAKAVHAGCVAWNGRGVLLCGDSGAGKSTLSYGCARSGWEYISDDGSFVLDEEEPIVTGNSHSVRLRPSAAELFPEIQGMDQTPRAAGKPSIEISTHRLPRIIRRQRVRVDFIVFLKRGSTSPARLEPYRKDVARLYMREGVYGNAEIRERQFAAVERLLAADVLELHYSDLGSAIERLRRLVEDGR
ncbi:MAG TPA: hypothetical protein VN734_10810 [Acidobacteriaceae bacterium]|nr:hypothetical protein [Acidobacteriaceae bacterium]